MIISRLRESAILARGCALVLLALLCWGCGAVQTQKRLDTLETSVMSFAKLLRWGYYEEAAQYLLSPDLQPIPVDFEVLQDIRVTSYNIIDRRVAEDQLNADIQVTIGYYHQESGVVRTFSEHQHWWYSVERETWLLDGKMPDFLASLERQR